jgi:hypothetical protein
MRQGTRVIISDRGAVVSDFKRRLLHVYIEQAVLASDFSDSVIIALPIGRFSLSK